MVGHMSRRHSDRYFETHFLHLPERDRLWQPVVAYLQERFIPEESTVLDLGAGYCNFINHVRARERHALDHSEIVTQYAAPGVITHVQECTDLAGIPDGKFDVVFTSNLLEHLDRDEAGRTISEVRRVLKSGGTFVIIQPNFAFAYRRYFDDYTHRQIFTHVSLSTLLESFYFEIIAVEPKFLPLTIRERLPRVPFFVKLYLRSPWRPFAGQMLVVAGKPAHARN